MKRSRFTEEQIISVLREEEAGVKAADLARQYRCDTVSNLIEPCHE